MTGSDWIDTISGTGLEWYYAFRPDKRPAGPPKVTPPPDGGGGGPAALLTQRSFGVLIVVGVLAVVGLLLYLILR